MGCTGNWLGTKPNQVSSNLSWRPNQGSKTPISLHNYVGVPKALFTSSSAPCGNYPSSDPSNVPSVYSHLSLPPVKMSKLALGTRTASTFIRALQFAISALILGIFSYYLASQFRKCRFQWRVLTPSQSSPVAQAMAPSRNGSKLLRACPALPLSTLVSP